MALSSDPNTIVLSYALHEEPLGEEQSALGTRVDNGLIIGEQGPVGNHNLVFLFRGISNRETYNPAISEADTRRVLNRFMTGGELRVYRSFPVDLSEFTYPRSFGDVNWGDNDNPDGYSDMVVVDVRDVTFQWFDNVLQRFEFEVEGVKVR